MPLSQSQQGSGSCNHEGLFSRFKPYRTQGCLECSLLKGKSGRTSSKRIIRLGKRNKRVFLTLLAQITNPIHYFLSLNSLYLRKTLVFTLIGTSIILYYIYLLFFGVLLIECFLLVWRASLVLSLDIYELFSDLDL